MSRPKDSAHHNPLTTLVVHVTIHREITNVGLTRVITDSLLQTHEDEAENGTISEVPEILQTKIAIVVPTNPVQAATKLIITSKVMIRNPINLDQIILSVITMVLIRTIVQTTTTIAQTTVQRILSKVRINPSQMTIIIQTTLGATAIRQDKTSRGIQVQTGLA